MPRFKDLSIFDRQSLKEINLPCFIYDLAAIGEKIEAIRDAFSPISFTQYYPIKVNSCLDVVRYCVEQGLGIDACSMGDLEIAGILDVPSANISFTGVGLNEQEMRLLQSKKIIPNLGSIEEIKRWGQLFPDSSIGVRVSTINPGVKSAVDYAIKMGILGQDWPAIRTIILKHNLDIVKIHRHESKGFISHEDLLKSFSTTLEAIPIWAWKSVRTINFGGGWGLPYLREGQLDLKKLTQGIVDITNKLTNTLGLGKVGIAIEPGEYLVGESGYLLTKVIDVRRIRSPHDGTDVQIVILDTPFPPGSGFRDAELLYPVTFSPVEGMGQEKEDVVFTKIYGRSNTAMDTINKGVYLPAVEVEQLALVSCVGAYVPVLMTYFNEQDIPPEYLLADGEFVLSRERLEFKKYFDRAYLGKRSNQ